MFIVMSRFTVSNDMIDEVKQAFVNRPHLVDQSPGFVRMDVISPADNPNEIVLLTFWYDEHSFKSWHRSHKFRESHRWIPKGLKLVPKSTKLQSFEYVTS